MCRLMYCVDVLVDELIVSMWLLLLSIGMQVRVEGVIFVD